MTCPRCRSRSLMRNHDSLGCLLCGHSLFEPEREAWDPVSKPRGGGEILGPAWTEEERTAWEWEKARR